MASQSTNGVWVYRSRDRQGSYRLLLVERDNGTIVVQRQRFNEDGRSIPVSASDTFEAADHDAAVEQIRKWHVQLLARRWGVSLRSGVATKISLGDLNPTNQAPQLSVAAAGGR